MDKNQVKAMLNCLIDNNLNFTPTSSNTVTTFSDGFTAGNSLDNSATTDMTCWHYWEDYHYPYVIRESYPVYVQERALDKGKMAFEIIKMLKDGKFINLRTVGNFIDLMDKLIKIL